MKRLISEKLTLLGGSGIAAGVLASSAAHAQLFIQNPNLTVSTPDTIYFDVDQASISTSDTSLEGFVATDAIPFGWGKVGQQTGDIEFTDTLGPGSVVDGSASFSTANKLTNGTNNYGFELGSSTPSTHYGYLTITQTTSTVDTSTIYTDTLNTVVYEQTVGKAVTVAPEPGTTSLFLSAAAGAAALLAWRRRGAAFPA